MGENHRIRELMTEARTVSSDATVVEAARVMRDDDVGLVPVVDGDRLVGTVTDRDIAIRVVAEERSSSSTTVREIASTDLVTIDPEQELGEALRLMAQHRYGALGRGERTAGSWASWPRPTSRATATTPDRPGRRADLAVERGCRNHGEPRECGARRRIRRKDSGASDATRNEAWVSLYCGSSHHPRGARCADRRGGILCVRRHADGRVPRLQAGRRHLCDGDTLTNFGRSQCCESMPRRRRPRSCASG